MKACPGAIEVLDYSVYQQNIFDKQSYRWENLPFSKEEVRIAYQRQILDITNASRAEFGLKPLLLCTKATEAAKGHSEDYSYLGVGVAFRIDGTYSQ